MGELLLVLFVYNLNKIVYQRRQNVRKGYEIGIQEKLFNCQFIIFFLDVNL